MTPAPSTEPPRIRTERRPGIATAIGSLASWLLLGAGAIAWLALADWRWIVAALVAMVCTWGVCGSVDQIRRARQDTAAARSEARAVARTRATLAGHPSTYKREPGPLFRPGGDDATKGANS